MIGVTTDDILNDEYDTQSVPFHYHCLMLIWWLPGKAIMNWIGNHSTALPTTTRNDGSRGSTGNGITIFVVVAAVGGASITSPYALHTRVPGTWYQYPYPSNLHVPDPARKVRQSSYLAIYLFRSEKRVVLTFFLSKLPCFVMTSPWHTIRAPPLGMWMSSHMS